MSRRAKCDGNDAEASEKTWKTTAPGTVILCVLGVSAVPFVFGG